MLKRLFLILLALLPLPLQAESLRIAAAADLVYCLDDLNALFKKQHPQADVKLSTGSSGNFFAQIQGGAPYDVFLSADMKYPQALVQAGLADPASLTRYAIGRIALWTLRRDVDVSRGLVVLKDPAVRRIAIANPSHAPYGRAAQSAMARAGVWDAVQGRLIMGENISQTAQFVQSGNADVGVVALSLLKSPKLAGQGSYYAVPLDSYPRMDQGLVLTRRGAANPLARAYIEFLRSAEARAVFNRYGFLLPE
ncbi:MAG: molybdate ABC transporter substrate-binding protein [Pseudomonadota bacterium]|uniref:molybdate ABC transporter substrate-binding protein n=1 Tax=Thermithiobacillus tepidarius TaxID=929 RepID=UPI00040B80D9|nr:molybdate ABC transporter substrate-binding protein [Thermithiobacillus tepidarius]